MSSPKHQPITTTASQTMADSNGDGTAPNADNAHQPSAAAATTPGDIDDMERRHIFIEPTAAPTSMDETRPVTAKPKPAASRLLRRAFSMPRNPFRLSARKLLKLNGGSGTASNSLDENSATVGAELPYSAAMTLASSTGSYIRTGEVHSKLLQASRSGLEHDAPNSGDGVGNCDAGDSSKAEQLNVNKRRAHSWRKVILRLAHQMTSIGTKQSHALTAACVQRVPPLSAGYLDAWPPDQIPGVIGLKNHGNTCFMNAVLQCLSHTDILAEYFVLDQYKVDLKRRNKLTSRKFGTKGELTEQLALVLKALWTCKLESDWSTTVGFKAVVDRYGTQFRSAQQHDAQEFLFWLLDKVHEDLNTAPKRKYKTMKNTFGRPDAVLAAETLANHVRGNRSFVQAVFQAQFRSSLACPQCHRQSNTFDPFHCISVQLPQQQHVQLPIYVTVRYAAQHPRQVRLGLSIPAGAPVRALRAQLQTDTGIDASRIVLVELADDVGFGRVLADSYTLDATAESTAVNVYCMETPLQSANAGDAAEQEARKCDGLLTVLVANARRTVDAPTTLQRFGTPFCLEIRRDVTYAELQKRLLKEMQHVLRPDVFAYAVQPADMFRMRLQDPSADNDAYMETRVEHPLFMEMIDLALVVLASDAGPAHVKLLLEWSEPERFFADMADDAVEHESVTLVREQATASGKEGGAAAALSLEQCLEHYTRAETLGAEDAWRCPHCQQYLPVVKTLGLWSLPEILVIHFKRFAAQQHLVTASSSATTNNGTNESVHSAAGRTAAKLTTAVTFPLTGFDMTPHLAQQQRQQQQQQQQSPSGQHSQRNGHRKSLGSSSGGDSDAANPPETQNLYDLYAVCYHQGETLETGHYTAACKNPYDQQWYRFDDQKVTPVPGGEQTAAEIVNNEAYILFYQRRMSAGCDRSGASTTVNGSLSTGLSSLGLSEHWVSRIAPVPPVSPMSSSVSQGSIGLSFGTAATAESEPIKVTVVEESPPIEAEVADVVVNAADNETVEVAFAEPTICDVPVNENVLKNTVADAPDPVGIEQQMVVCTATFEQPQFAELCQKSPSTSASEESPQPSPPARIRSQPINRGSLSFSEVFRRRDPLIYMDTSGSSGGVNMCASRHSADHRTQHSFLSEDMAVRPESLRSGVAGGGGGGSGSYLLIDNRSASWVS